MLRGSGERLQETSKHLTSAFKHEFLDGSQDNLSSKQRDPNPDTKSLIRTQCCKRIMTPSPPIKSFPIKSP